MDPNTYLKKYLQNIEINRTREENSSTCASIDTLFKPRTKHQSMRTCVALRKSSIHLASALATEEYAFMAKNERAVVRRCFLESIKRRLMEGMMNKAEATVTFELVEEIDEFLETESSSEEENESCFTSDGDEERDHQPFV